MQQDPLGADAFQQAYQFQQDPGAGDRTLNVRFFLDEIIDEAASALAARPIYKSVEMCEIRYGDKDNIVSDRVKYMHPDPRLRFPEQWKRFKAGEETQVVGTLLRQWGLIPAAEARSYEAIGIVTVEQLAGLSDMNAQQVRGSIADRQKARDFLAMAAGQAPVSQARAENEALRREVQALRDAVEALGGRAPAKTPPYPASFVSTTTPPTVTGVTLNKDGTPRKRSGPKPKLKVETPPDQG